MINKIKDLSTYDVYTRISFKARKEINELDSEERDKLEDLLIEDYAEKVHRLSDELILQEAIDKGVVL